MLHPHPLALLSVCAMASACLCMVATLPVSMTVGYLAAHSCMEDCPEGYAGAGADSDSDYGNNHSVNATLAQAARDRCGCGLGAYLFGAMAAAAMLVLVRMLGAAAEAAAAVGERGESFELLDSEGELMGG
jgi:hypothetical protein